jgi:hypothetical protein
LDYWMRQNAGRDGRAADSGQDRATVYSFAQLPRQVGLRFPHWAVHRSVVVFALLGFVIAAEINPYEPSAIASCDDLANFASHRDFLLGSQERAHWLHTQ